MAREFIDGFEAGTLDLWDATGSPCSISTDSIMNGVRCMWIWNQGWVQKNLTSRGELYIAFWVYLHTANATRILQIKNGSTVLATLNRNASTANKLYITLGDWGTGAIRTGATPIPHSTIHKIGIHFKLDGTNGIFRVIVDGLEEMNFEGNTTTIGPIVLDNIVFGGDNGIGIDNVVIDDAEIPIGTRIQVLVPTGPGTHTDFTPSTGANWECMNEVPTSVTDYVKSKIADSLDTYEVNNLTNIIADIKSVQVQSVGWVDGINPLPKMENVLIVGGVECVGAQHTLSNSPQTFVDFFEFDPSVPAEPTKLWTEATINAMEVGIKSKAI